MIIIRKMIIIRNRRARKTGVLDWIGYFQLGFCYAIVWAVLCRARSSVKSDSRVWLYLNTCSRLGERLHCSTPLLHMPSRHAPAERLHREKERDWRRGNRTTIYRVFEFQIAHRMPTNFLIGLFYEWSILRWEFQVGRTVYIDEIIVLRNTTSAL